METQNIEYKPSWRDEYLKVIVAFANKDGGELIVGVDDNGNPIECQEQGLPEPDFEEEHGVFVVKFYQDKWNEENLKKLEIKERQIKAVMYVDVCKGKRENYE
jgi:predicted HTH transcriptional regulator